MEKSNLIASKSFFEENPITIAINFNHCFVIKLANKNILPITSDTAVNLLRLLVFEYHTFYREIEKLVEELKPFNHETTISASEFPFGILVKTALNSERDYWIELSIPWLKEIGKNHFLEDIESLQKNKNISQKTRHLFLTL